MNKTSLPSRKKNRLEMFLYKEWMFYVTINVQDHICVFGEVVNEEIKLNQYGKIVEECLLRLPQQYDYVSLWDFMIMPNHIHVIIDIDSVGNGRDRSLRPKRKNLSSLIWAFKTTSSKKLHDVWLQSFKRQKSFYDHVIRNEADLQRIQEYIEINPYKRKNDEYYR